MSRYKILSDLEKKVLIDNRLILTLKSSLIQSHYIEVPQGAIVMELNMYEIWPDFGPIGNSENSGRL
jgi:hypothetical protein